ncbi:hypothetical protein ACFYOV_00065 [Streptomyces sp. NPDC005931]|uniref:hypothetical protein n=1 Tax=Streptomyces sp. NPDC005931 TaxID=3364737 RepID=UPI0036CF26D9
MRRTRIEKQRRTSRARRHADEAYTPFESLDPRDPDIVRAKRLRLQERLGADEAAGHSSRS